MSERRSARTHIASRGHVPLPEARRWAVEQVEAAEVVRDELRAVVATAAKARKEAEEAHAAALVQIRDANAKLHRAREDLAYRMGDTDG